MTGQRTDLQDKRRVYAAAGVAEYWVLDLPVREVVVHTRPGAKGCGSVVREAWTAPRSVLGMPLDLAAVLSA